MKVDLTVNKARGVQRTDIEWADYSANPIRAVDRQTGEVGWACRKVSAGCANCYAEALNKRFGTKHPYTAAGLGQVEQVLDEGVLRKLLTMKPRGPFKNGRERPAVFLGDMMDLFYGDEADKRAAKAAGVPFAPIPFDMLDRVFAVMALRSDMDFLLLTKRPERMREYLTYLIDGPGDLGFWMSECHQQRTDDPSKIRFTEDFDAHGWEPCSAIHAWPLPNVWLGTSVEDQAAAEARIPHLLRCPAAVRFLSCEPLLGAVDLLRVDAAGFGGPAGHKIDAIRKGYWSDYWGFVNHSDMHKTFGDLHWVIVGGESGRNARACHLGWIRKIIEQCQSAGILVFTKQLGSAPIDGEGRPTGNMRRGQDAKLTHIEIAWDRMRLTDPKGGDTSEWPTELRVRQIPGGGQ